MENSFYCLVMSGLIVKFLQQTLRHKHITVPFAVILFVYSVIVFTLKRKLVSVCNKKCTYATNITELYSLYLTVSKRTPWLWQPSHDDVVIINTPCVKEMLLPNSRTYFM